MIENIVFDLDGTLWQTGASYLYSYHKLCKIYHVDNPVSDEDLLAYLGIRLDQFLLKLFPGAPSFETLANQAVAFSIEYITQQKEPLFYKGIIGLIQQLKHTYRLFVVSHCPYAYAEAFTKLSGTEDAFIGLKTIDLGEKSDHITNIASSCRGKTLYVGDAEDDYQAIVDHNKVMFAYAKYGYRPCIHYDFKLSKPDDLLTILKQIEIKERQLANKSYRVYSYFENQVTIMNNQDGNKYFGFVNYIDHNFEQVLIDVLKGEKGQIIGPIDGNTYYPYRFALDNFDLQLYPDCYNGREVVDLFLKHGFKIKQYYSSTLATINERLYQETKKIKLPKKFAVKIAHDKEVYLYLEQIYKVAVDAFKKADYYEDISKEDFMDLYIKNIELVHPDMVLLFDEDKLIGFNFCYEDLQKRFYVAKTVAILSSYQNMKLIMILLGNAYQMMMEKGQKEVLYHFQNDRTKTMAALRYQHEIKTKHYGLLEIINEI